MRYWQQLNDYRWKQWAREYLEAIGWKCEDCGRYLKPLEIHHFVYRLHLLLWEHSHEDVRALCRQCHQEREILKRARELITARNFANCDRIYESEATLRLLEDSNRSWNIVSPWGDGSIKAGTAEAVTLYFLRPCNEVGITPPEWDKPYFQFEDRELNNLLGLLEVERFERFIVEGMAKLHLQGVRGVWVPEGEAMPELEPAQTNEKYPFPWLKLADSSEQSEFYLGS